jgi:Flp pilus assembly pilin Flp
VHRLRHEDGQASIEYAVLASLISIAAVSLMAAIGLRVQSLLQAFLDVFS